MRHKLYYFQPLPDEKSNKSEIKKNQIKLKKMMQRDPNRTHITSRKYVYRSTLCINSLQVWQEFPANPLD